MSSIVVACFLFSMGNKPSAYVVSWLFSVSHLISYVHRSKWKYKLAAIILSCLMLYMIIASIACAVQAAHQGGSANSTMLLSIAVTYGCTLMNDLIYPHHMLTSLILFFIVYALSSILAFDPWHMVTSFVPYIFLSPAYINILNMLVITYHLYWTKVINILSYAFSNLDDVNLFFGPNNTLI